jgi:hypothetical protein
MTIEECIDAMLASPDCIGTSPRNNGLAALKTGISGLQPEGLKHQSNCEHQNY